VIIKCTANTKACRLWKYQYVLLS